MRALVVAALVLVGCGDDRGAARPAPPTPTPTPIADAQEPVMTDAAPAADAPLEYEGVTLLSTLDDLRALAAAKGWRQNASPSPDQIVTVFTTPDHPVKRYKLGYEVARLISIEIDYRQPDAARLALRERFVHTRNLDGAWYLTDDGHTVLASVDDAGKTVRALHLAAMRDRREADAMLQSAFGVLPRSDER